MATFQAVRQHIAWWTSTSGHRLAFSEDSARNSMTIACELCGTSVQIGLALGSFDRTVAAQPLRERCRMALALNDSPAQDR